MANRIVSHLEPPGAKPMTGPVMTGAPTIPDWKQWLAPAEEIITKYPGVTLASAFVVGAALAWWIKRK